MFACYKRIDLQYEDQVIENMLFLIQNWLYSILRKLLLGK